MMDPMCISTLSSVPRDGADSSDDVSCPQPPALHVFIRRLVRLTATTLPTFLLAHVYLTRLVIAVTAAASKASLASAPCSRDAAHRVFLAALLLATKVSEDPPALPSGSSVTSTDSTASCSSSSTLCMSASSPATLAAICGVYTSREVQTMERSLLKALGHRLWVSAPRMAEFLDRLCDAEPELALAGGEDLLHLLRG
ncbi:hypothetical protein BCR44DRAFT_1495565 [Catenaria anguillulae PL171]|uniref:Cyclin N-terminal domain-containing protein n=1 Tax=Catenaria anguillulae PL171 TaxID=765915 RepID=A0A1Y2I2F4_9FUNG|nr:hypothetical protein BCR44DRAFT_1495565 [Catenaria anguillulae PL171]